MNESVVNTQDARNQKSSSTPSWLLSALCILFLGAASAYFFRGVFNPANSIEGLDSPMWLPMFMQKWTDGLFIPRWSPHFFVGYPQQYQFLSHSLPLMMILPPHRYYGFQFMLDSFLAGAFMFAFLRSLKIGRFGSLVGGIGYQLGNNLLTNASLGVLWKFSTVCWVPLFLLFFTRVIKGGPNRLRNSLFAGATLGMQFLGGEVQLAYYTGLLAIVYFVFESADRLWNSQGIITFSESMRNEGKRLLWSSLCAVFAVIFAAEVLFSYASFTQINENVEQDNWRFVTEFSFPPRETVALALSSHVFETDEYPLKYQGQPLLRISDDYFGIVILLFAAIALVSGNRKTCFFASMAVVALILSFGSFFPFLFRLVYLLPVMRGLRNMHKWIFIMALCVSILAGIGADFWRNASPEKNKRIFRTVIIFFILMVILAFLSPFLAGNSSRAIPSAVYGKIAILAVASILCLVGRMKKIRDTKGLHTVLPLIIIFLMAGDLTQNASRFMKYFDYRERFINDELVKWLLSKPRPFRVKLWAENPYSRFLMADVLPYHGIDVADAIVSRRPVRYSHIFDAVRNERLSYEKFFQLFNVKYIISSAAVRGTDIPLSLGGMFRSNPHGQPARRTYVYELDSWLPRAYIVNKFEVLPPENVIDFIARPDSDLHRVVALEKEPGLKAGEDPEWSIKNFSQSPHRVSMHVTLDRPAILVLQDFMDKYWHAHVDTEEVEIMPANYLMRAIVVPQGVHTIVFTYEPPLWGFATTLAGCVVVISIAVFVAARKMTAK